MTRSAVPLLRPGRNCWAVKRSERLAILVDAAAYYAAFVAAVERAERWVGIVAWDIDSRTCLRPPGEDETEPLRLRELFHRVLEQRPGLEIHILCWDFSPLYALEREKLTKVKLEWSRPRLHFELDAGTPAGGSHHQKIVVVDDAIAFAGGLDVAGSRWDTPAHDQVCCCDPSIDEWKNGEREPFHDVQIAVSGDAARALGDLVRARWRRATGEKLGHVSRRKRKHDPWPEALVPDAHELPIGIARTEPAIRDRDEVREVERLDLDAIAAARRSIYLETQYLTSEVITGALAARLGEPDGPEVVIVCPEQASGWIERETIGVLTERRAAELYARDRSGRLRILGPRRGDVPIYVHSKVMVVDDRLARIGSSNLTNRSMAVDTECDIAIDAALDPRGEHVVSSVRNRLIAEHLGCKEQELAAAIHERRSLIGAIEALSGHERHLAPLFRPSGGPVDEEPRVDLLIPSSAIDPVEPLDGAALVSTALPEEEQIRRTRPMLRLGVGLVIALCLALAWVFTPLRELIDPTRIVEEARSVRANALGPVAVALAFVVGSLLMVPVNTLIIATGLVFGPWLGAAYSLFGSLVAAVAGFLAGRALGHDGLGKVGGKRVRRLAQTLAERGAVSFAFVRLVPVAHFGMVNLLAGALGVRTRSFVIGTLVGMSPGILVGAIFGDRLGEALLTKRTDDVLEVIGVALLALFVVVSTAFVLRRVLRKRSEREARTERAVEPVIDRRREAGALQ